MLPLIPGRPKPLDKLTPLFMPLVNESPSTQLFVHINRCLFLLERDCRHHPGTSHCLVNYLRFTGDGPAGSKTPFSILFNLIFTYSLGLTLILSFTRPPFCTIQNTNETVFVRSPPTLSTAV